MILCRYFFWNNLSKVMSSLLDNSSSPSEVDSLDLDEVSYRFIFNIIIILIVCGATKL